MNYYNDIKNELINNEINKRIKNYSINRGDLNTYYKVGKILSEAGKHYGEGIIEKYSQKLSSEVNKKYNKTNLKRMRQFYIMIEKGALIGHQIRNIKTFDMLSEKVLQKIILEDIELFMNELGNSFSFIGSEYKIRIGNVYNYIDILLFNYEYNCFVVIELKVTELKKEHIGQIQVYMNYIDDNLKSINQNKTIGIIICKEDNEYIINYCSDERIIARSYKII